MGSLALRLLDHADDLGEHGVGAHPRRAEGERAGLVDGAADDLGAPAPFSTGTGSPVIIDSST
jgi:hypothetical protein